MSIAFLAQVVLNGLNISAIYVLVALGFTLTFGIVRVINFAHGELAMTGGFAAYFLDRAGVPFLAAAPAAAALVALLTIPLERWLFRPFYRREDQAMIATLGLSIAMTYAAVLAFGTRQRSIPPTFAGTVSFGGVSVPSDKLAVLVVCLVTLALFYLWIKYTKIGLAMRVVAQDLEAAQIQGIEPLTAYRVAFAVSGGLAGLAGALLAQMYALSPFVGAAPLLKAFIVVVLGGLGSIPGAALGGLVLGMGESFLSTFYGASVSQFASFGAIIVLLIVRPQGLLGRVAR